MAAEQAGPKAIERTRPTRIAEDLAEKLGWVIELKGTPSADRLDPLIREQVEAWFAEIEPEVRKIKAAKARAMTKHHPAFAPELGEAGA